MSVDLTGAGPPQGLAIIKDQIAPGISSGDLAVFGEVCARLSLSYFAGHIVPVGRYDTKARRTVWRPQITVAGRRAIAARTGLLDGIEGPMWCGPRERGELVWRDVWDSDELPYCARVLIWRKDWAKGPANGTTKWSEFAQYDKDGVLADMWRKMPSHMLGKTAESLAYRRAFADEIGAAESWAGGWGSGDETEDTGPVDVDPAGEADQRATGPVPAASRIEPGEKAQLSEAIDRLSTGQRKSLADRWRQQQLPRLNDLLYGDALTVWRLINEIGSAGSPSPDPTEPAGPDDLSLNCEPSSGPVPTDTTDE